MQSKLFLGTRKAGPSEFLGLTARVLGSSDTRQDRDLLFEPISQTVLLNL